MGGYRLSYAPRVGGWGQASYTFPLRIMQKVGGWVTCIIAYVLNGRPQRGGVRVNVNY